LKANVVRKCSICRGVKQVAQCRSFISPFLITRFASLAVYFPSSPHISHRVILENLREISQRASLGIRITVTNHFFTAQSTFVRSCAFTMHTLRLGNFSNYGNDMRMRYFIYIVQLYIYIYIYIYILLSAYNTSDTAVTRLCENINDSLTQFHAAVNSQSVTLTRKMSYRQTVDVQSRNLGCNAR